MDKKLNILTLCTHNAARSQMAEALFRLRAGDRFNAYSAGLEPGEVHPLAIRAMEELGVDMSEHRSQGVKDYLGILHVHYLVIVCGGAAQKCPSVWPGVTERLLWPFEDPSAVEGSPEEQLQAFRDTRDQIDAKIQEWLRTLPEQSPVVSTPGASS